MDSPPMPVPCVKSPPWNISDAVAGCPGCSNLGHEARDDAVERRALEVQRHATRALALLAGAAQRGSQMVTRGAATNHSARKFSAVCHDGQDSVPAGQSQCKPSERWPRKAQRPRGPLHGRHAGEARAHVAVLTRLECDGEVEEDARVRHAMLEQFCAAAINGGRHGLRVRCA